MTRAMSHTYDKNKVEQIPLRWTAPEVHPLIVHENKCVCMRINYLSILSMLLSSRHWLNESTVKRVMSTAMEWYCLRYGLLAANHFLEKTITR